MTRAPQSPEYSLTSPQRSIRPSPAAPAHRSDCEQREVLGAHLKQLAIQLSRFDGCLMHQTGRLRDLVEIIANTIDDSIQRILCQPKRFVRFPDGCLELFVRRKRFTIGRPQRQQAGDAAGGEYQQTNPELPTSTDSVTPTCRAFPTSTRVRARMGCPARSLSRSSASSPAVR